MTIVTVKKGESKSSRFTSLWLMLESASNMIAQAACGRQGIGEPMDQLPRTLLIKPVVFATLAPVMLISVFLLLPDSAETQATSAQYTITDGPNGGDCEAIGSWNNGTKFCVLDTGILIDHPDRGIVISGSGITVSGGDVGAGHGQHIDGIVIEGSNNTVQDTNVSGFQYGIKVETAGSNMISGNTLADNEYQIFIDGTDDNTIDSNTISYGMYAIELTAGSDDNTVSANDISDNKIGVGLTAARNNTISDNTVLNGYTGIGLDPGSDGNSLIGNHVSWSWAYGFYAWEADGNSFINNTAFNNGTDGFFLDNCSGNELNGNIADQNGGGIEWQMYDWSGFYLHDSSGNTLIGNSATDNIDFGISVDMSYENIIIGNDIVSHIMCGLIVINESNNNLSDNVIVRNNFIDNNTQVMNYNPDDGILLSQPAPTGGNYWSDHDEPAEGCEDLNADGFCDSPYGDIDPYAHGYTDELPWTTRDGWCGIKPPLTLSKTGVFWESYQDYLDRLLTVEYSVPSFFDIGDVDLEGIISTNGVTPAILPPSPLDSSFSVRYFVPIGVNNFSTTVYITAEDLCGNSYSYPGPYPGI